MSHSLTDRLAVCSWSLQPGDPAELFARLREIGIAAHPARARSAARGARRLGRAAASCCAQQRDHRRSPACSARVGEDYSTLETIRVTGGVVPDATWDAELANIQAAAAPGAGSSGLKLVTFHAGFLPHDEADPDFAKLLAAPARRWRTLFADREHHAGASRPARRRPPALRGFLEKLKRPNVGVNFDPANMILYDKGDPIAALRVLGPWIRQVPHQGRHGAPRCPAPGARKSSSARARWTGRRSSPRSTNSDFTGDFCIEREAGTQRVADILTAKQLVASSPDPALRTSAASVPKSHRTMHNRIHDTSNRKVNVAVVGLGFMGVTHLKAYQTNPGRPHRRGVRRRAPAGRRRAARRRRQHRRRRRARPRHASVKVYRAPRRVARRSGRGPGGPLRAHAAARAETRHRRAARPASTSSARNRWPAPPRWPARSSPPPRTAKGFFMPAMCMRFWPEWAWLKQAVDRRPLRQGAGRALPPRLRAARLEPRQLLQRRAIRRRPARPAHPRHRLRPVPLRPADERVFQRRHAVQRRDRPCRHPIPGRQRRGGLRRRQLADDRRARLQHGLHRQLRECHGGLRPHPRRRRPASSSRKAGNRA